MTKTIFLDTETTGADTELCGVYQIAGVIEIDRQVIEEFDIRSNIFPQDLIVDEAMEKTNMTLDAINSYPIPLKAFSSFNKIMRKHVDSYNKKDKFTVIGYNSDFDNRVLRRWFLMNDNNFFGSWFWHPWIDVMQLAAYIYQDCRSQFENFKLETVANFVGIQVDKDSMHDALYDARITREIYYALIQ